MEQWCDDNNMDVNKKKSGIIPFTSGLLHKEYREFPIVTEYKYLGMVLDHKLSLDGHLVFINKKFAYISSRLLPLRSRNNLKINRNLFLLMITPIYRLAFTITSASKANTDELIKHYKIKFKIFCRLPITTPHHTVNLILGDPLEHLLTDLATLAAKSETRKSVAQALRVAKTERIQHFPLRLTELLQLAYTTKCRPHYTMTCTTHLR